MKRSKKKLDLVLKNGTDKTTVAQESNQNLEVSSAKRSKVLAQNPKEGSSKGHLGNKTSVSRKLIFRDEEVLSANNNATKICKRDLLEAGTSFGVEGVQKH